MNAAPKTRKTSTTETGQIPRELLEAYQAAETAARDGNEGEDSNSITGVFRMDKRRDGKDASKERHDAPQTGSAPSEPAKQ
jgi:hypothetical protein